MEYSIKLLVAALLALGVFSAYADSETDRYMASAGASAAKTQENDQQSGPMSPVTASYLSYVSPCVG